MDTSFELADQEVRLHVRLLQEEVQTFVERVVQPTWNDVTMAHHFPRTLYGYVMNAFAFVDLLSQYDSGVGTQTERLTRFLESRLGIDREAASVAVQMWRHTLMHGGNPRPLPRSQGGDLAEGRYLWLLHWGEPWLKSPDNMTLVDGASDRILNLGLTDFISDLRLAAESLLEELSLTAEGRSCVEAVEQRIAKAPIA